MNDLLTYIVLLGLSLWLLARPHEAESGNNLMQGQLKRLWNDAYQNIAQNDISRAERSLLALLKLDEKNLGAYNKLGTIYARQGLKREAIECFEISSGINPNPASLHNLALVYFYDGQYEKAARAFEQAADKDPENPSRRIALAKAFERMEEPKAAIKELEKAHRLSPGSQGSLELARVYRQVGAPDLAEQVEHESKELKKIADRSGAHG
jgi:tetratricopeptide (TPR) repeat protein